ncbi:MAG: hypothetical protein ABF572_13345 [Gluconobacter sp.]|uniref:hypothetical protein n=1 Tax=Gluconobacter sp. TaxID=1876758 RepID=UPI0039EA8A65
MPDLLTFKIRSEFPEGLLEELCNLIARRIDDIVSVVLANVLKDLTACPSLENAGLAKDEIVVRWLRPQDLDGKVLSAFRVLGRDMHEGRIFGHSSSSVLSDGESGDSVAADPRNDATPDTSVKGVRDDA